MKEKYILILDKSYLDCSSNVSIIEYCSHKNNIRYDTLLLVNNKILLNSIFSKNRYGLNIIGYI